MGFLERFVNGSAPGISAPVLNEPFNVQSAAVSGTTLTVVLEAGRLDWGDGTGYTIASGATASVTKTGVSAGLDYYVYVRPAGGVIFFGPPPFGTGSGVCVAKISTGMPVTNPCTITDLRGTLPVAGGATLGPWLTPTLTNGWVDYGSGTQFTRYRKDCNGEVTVQGLIKNGTMGASALLFPLGYRPYYTLKFPAVDGLNSAGAVDVGPTGTVTPIYGNNGFFSLSAIRFLAEQ
jgi:hypothetical protein